MSGRITRHSRREDARSRRKTVRQSALDAKRGNIAAQVSREVSSTRPTRGVVQRQAAARLVEEMKKRKAVTAREVQNAKPPFNPYVRVKHTGLSPFGSFQDAQKRSKIAPWRSQAGRPVSTISSSARPANTGRAPAPGIAAITKAAQQASIPEIKMASGVVQFPILPHMQHAKITFRAPAKVQPLPLPTRSTKPAGKKEVAKENVKPPTNTRQVRGVTAKTHPKQVPNPPTKSQKGLQVVKPVKKLIAPVAAPVRNPIPTRTRSVAPPKPMPRLGTRSKPAATLRQPLTEVPNKAKQNEKDVTNQDEPPMRVLRSSSRLQHKEPILELPLVRRRRTEKPKNPVIDKPEPEQIEVESDPTASTEVAAVVDVVIPDERTKGLEERKGKLTKETDRLRSLADEWVATKNEQQLTRNAIDEIDAVTGQTYLLISKKFIQYRGLIEGAYTNPKTTFDDLDGFWEMMFIQVDQLDNQYRKLEDLKKRNWVSYSPAPVRKTTNKRVNPSKRLPAKTNFRKFLADKKKEMTESSSIEDLPPTGPNPSVLSPGLNMSVDDVVPSPSRTSHIWRNTRTTLNSPGPSGARTIRRSARWQLSSPSARNPKQAESPHATCSPVSQSPRALDNARRASRSIRLSTSMMRASLVIANDLDLTIPSDPLEF